MKKTTLLLLCCGLLMCSVCNKAVLSPTESVPTVILETVITDENTDDSSEVAESVTTEKEESASAVSKPVETYTPIVIEEEPKETVEIEEISEPIQETYIETKEEFVEQEIADYAEVERLVIKYINEFRVAQGDTTAKVLPGLTEVARYRANQLIDNFAHIDIREACAKLKYGRYFDMTEYGMDAKYNYYEGYDREAICKGEWFGTADIIAKNIAEGFKNSTKHWEYVGDSKYRYIAVGITYNEADKYWYGCVCMSAENYGGQVYCVGSNPSVRVRNKAHISPVKFEKIKYRK